MAWKDIEPYHPWFSKQLGYNLYFAKAIANNNAYGYSVVADEGIWDEKIPKRNFIRINFEKPKNVTKEFISVKLAKRKLSVAEPLMLTFVSITNKASSKAIEVKIQNDSSTVFLQRKINHKLERKLKTELFKFDLNKLKPNHYTIFFLSDKDTIAQYDFVVFPKLDFNVIRSQISKNKHHLKIGSVHTLLFKIDLIQLNLNKLTVYETGKDLLDDYANFAVDYHQFLSGSDPYKGITTPYRRAFKSKNDNTYQPYTIKLPKNYNPAKQYPLLVFLHGSGQDEQNLLNSARSGGNFIEVAPYARDKYQCYASDSSQTDIIEAIEDVMLHFSVDKDKIIIGGFSMGGYGALRTFYEHPNSYKGVAVFAGHPNLANDWLGAGHPNFLEDKFINLSSIICE